MSKLLKVTMEFEDKIQELSGEDAQKWLDACNSITTMSWIHGNSFPKFNWQIKEKK